MILSCPICQEIFMPTCEAVVNRCGHLFHLYCLQKWFLSCGKRPKTCPQCRAPAVDSDIIKIFFNISESSVEQDDPATLQCKLDNANFQVQLKEAELSKIRDGIGKEKTTNKRLRKLVLELEQKSTNTDSLIAVLKTQIREFSSQNTIIDKLRAENRTLSNELEILNDLRTVVKGATDEVSDMLENYQNPKALAVMVTTIKKELVNQSSKKQKLEKQIKSLEYSLRENEKKLQIKDEKLLKYEVLYEEAKRKIEQLQTKVDNQKSLSSSTVISSSNLTNLAAENESLDCSKSLFEQTDPDVHHSTPQSTKKHIDISGESPKEKLSGEDLLKKAAKASANLLGHSSSTHSTKLAKNLKIVNYSDSLNEELEKARSSQSPYLKLSQASYSRKRPLGSFLSVDKSNFSEIRPIKKPRLLADQFDKYKPLPEEAFNGMGGHPPIEEFPKPKKSIIKNKKLRRLAPLGARPEKPNNNSSILDTLSLL